MVTNSTGILVYFTLTIVSLIVVRWLWLKSYDGDQSTTKYFTLDGGKSYHSVLTCDDIVSDVVKLSLIGEGGVKTVHLAKWKGFLIALSELKDERYKDDFKHNLQMLNKLESSGKVVKTIGQCNQTIILTQFHPFGSPLDLPIWTRRWKTLIKDEIDCFKLCLSYAGLIDYLHTSYHGPLVMCDSNSLGKLLSQLLVTNDLQLIANDLDALPKVEKGMGIKCGSRQITGDFAAPEQLWPFPGRQFNDSEMPYYDEQIDIWRIPDVCSWFLSLRPTNQELLNQLKPLHLQCKSRDPQSRPNSSFVYQVYAKVYQKFSTPLT